MGSSPRPIVLKLTDSPVGTTSASDSRMRIPPPPPSADDRSHQTSQSPPRMHRFGPSGPWPWTSFSANVVPLDDAEAIPSRKTTRGARPAAETDESAGHEWRHYPASHFPNWTEPILRRSGIAEVLEKEDVTATTVRTIDVLANGHFRVGPTFTGTQTQELWQTLLEDASPDIRVTCYFVEDLSGTIMQVRATYI